MSNTTYEAGEKMSKSSIERISAAEQGALDRKRALSAEFAAGISDAHAEAEKAVGQASENADARIAAEKALALERAEKLVAEESEKARAEAEEICRKASENAGSAIKTIIAEIAGK